MSNAANKQLTGLSFLMLASFIASFICFSGLWLFFIILRNLSGEELCALITSDTLLPGFSILYDFIAAGIRIDSHKGTSTLKSGSSEELTTIFSPFITVKV